ncbi:diuretic hormone class 2 [Sipha flava]|nr:diuretic hormone class 2 [Sipha flava]
MFAGHMMVGTSVACGLSLVVILMCTIPASLSAPYPMLQGQNNAFLSSENDGDPEVMLELLARIGQNIMRANELENSKRGLDLGLSRGYSGTQAAKHLMGMAAANFAGGPGRRRRSDMLPKLLTP